MPTPSRVFASLVSAALALPLGACGTRYLPPPRAPERVAPAAVAEAPPLREGEGQVTLDVADGPSRAELVTERTQVVAGSVGWSTRSRYPAMPMGTQLTTRPLCVTPCAVNLPLGQHEISFTSMDDPARRTGTGFINVTPHPSVVRHALGFQDTHLGGIIGSALTGAFSVSALLTGTVLVAINDDSRSETSGLMAPGIAVLGVGAALLATSIILGVHSRPESQNGSTVQWTPATP